MPATVASTWFIAARMAISGGSILRRCRPEAIDGKDGGPYGPPPFNQPLSLTTPPRPIFHGDHRSRFAERDHPGHEGQWEEAGTAGDCSQGRLAHRSEREGDSRNPAAA